MVGDPAGHPEERPGTYTILTTVYGDSEIEKWRGRWVCRSILKAGVSIRHTESIERVPYLRENRE